MANEIPSFPGGFVALTVLSASAFENLRNLLGPLSRQSAWATERSVELVQSDLASAFFLSGSTTVNGLARHAAGLETVTVDQRQNRRIGLHLDSWEACAFWQRRFARNRISINVGESARRLLFMATPIEIAFRKLGLQPQLGRYPVDQAITETPDRIRQVYRLEVRPGEAYIAPTECIVHDASTIGAAGLDCSITIRSLILPVAVSSTTPGQRPG